MQTITICFMQMERGNSAVFSSNSASVVGSRSRSNDWKKEFVQAMTLWQKLRDDLNDAKEQVAIASAAVRDHRERNTLSIGIHIPSLPFLRLRIKPYVKIYRGKRRSSFSIN